MEAHSITHAERLRLCLAGEALDRPPVALWRHFPVDDQNPQTLAAAALAFQRTFDFDLVKYTPASSFCLKDWGSCDAWLGDAEGTRTYQGGVIERPGDWERLPLLDPRQGFLGEQLKSLRLLVEQVGPETPVIQTIFSPLSQAKNLVGKTHLIAHLRRYPEALHAALRTITETTRRFTEAALETGIAGVFYAIQHAQYGVLTVDEYLEFGRAYDLQTLEPAEGLWLNMVHLHGEDIMFDEALFGRPGDKTLPVAVVNWHDQDTSPSLAEAQGRFPGVVCGGLQREKTMVLGTPAEVRQQAQAAVQATGGRRFILGTGCVLPITAPYGNILAARQSVTEPR